MNKLYNTDVYVSLKKKKIVKHVIKNRIEFNIIILFCILFIYINICVLYKKKDLV